MQSFISFFLILFLFIDPAFSEDSAEASEATNAGIPAETPSLSSSSGSGDAPWFKGRFKEFREKAADILEDRVALGTRMEYFKIKTEKDDFIGSINKLDAKQNYDPTRVFLDMTLARHWNMDFFLEASWTKIAMGTVTRENFDQNDGTLELSGPLFCLNASYSNDSRFTPYGGIGAVYFNHTSVSKGWWHYGFAPENGDWRPADREYANWRADGSPSWPNGGFTRTFELDKAWGWLVNAGCSVELIDNLHADINFRYTEVTVDNTYTMAFYGDPVDIRYSEFDVSHYTASLGLKYQF